VPIDRISTLLLAAGCALLLGACGGGDDKPTIGASPAPAPAQTQGQAQGGGERCPDVQVPGHQAVDVEATGVACAAAEKVAAAAQGRGRAAYESGGFECEPSDASGGDTTYRCTMGQASITFLYGTA
jgi:hypothetical protein